MKIEVHFDNKEWGGTTGVFIVQTDHTGKRMIAKPMTLEFVPLNPEVRTEPSLQFGPIDSALGFFQALSDGLARAGYRPESNDVGELKATKLHLADMQKMVFTNE